MVMMGVVYSAILKRCGVDPEDIKKIFEKGFITGALWNKESDFDTLSITDKPIH